MAAPPRQLVPAGQVKQRRALVLWLAVWLDVGGKGGGGLAGGGCSIRAVALVTRS